MTRRFSGEIYSDPNLGCNFCIFSFRYSLSEVTTRSNPVIPDEIFSSDLIQIPEKTKLGFDEIYLINLDRRKDRLERMK